MPINIDDELINELVKRQMAEQDAQAPASAPSDSQGVGTLAKLLYGAGAGADVASTAYGMGTGLVDERNPLVNWAPRSAQIPLGAGMELGSLYLANKLLGKKHPKIMKGIMMGLGGLHGGLALGNMKTIADARRSASAPTTSDQPPTSGMVQLSDGSWINPDYFGK